MLGRRVSRDTVGAAQERVPKEAIRTKPTKPQPLACISSPLRMVCLRKTDRDNATASFSRWLYACVLAFRHSIVECSNVWTKAVTNSRQEFGTNPADDYPTNPSCPRAKAIDNRRIIRIIDYLY